ncbi:MAG: hypothetical protein HW373_314 [Deltaproteobacteria bacterium]|nr:hypothetical protein [Deltaproteobacteria bacterium]
MEQRFVPALRRLHRLLEDASTELQITIRFALIGGLAVSTWGGIRATRDIDFLADSDPSPIGSRRLRDDFKKCLEEQHCRVEWRVGDPDDPIPLVSRLRLVDKSIETEADILWAYKRWHQEALQRRLEVKAKRLRVFVIHPEDLILLKLDAGGPQDLLDVRALLASKPPDLDVERLKRTAARIRLRKLLDSSLEEVKR